MAENADEAGDDQGVKRLRNPDAVLLHLHAAAQMGDLVAEGRRGAFHGGIITNYNPMVKGKMWVMGKFSEDGGKGGSLLFVNKKKQKKLYL